MRLRAWKMLSGSELKLFGFKSPEIERFRVSTIGRVGAFNIQHINFSSKLGVFYILLWLKNVLETTLVILDYAFKEESA